MKYLIKWFIKRINKSPRLYDFYFKLLKRILGVMEVSEISHATNCEDIIASFYCKKAGFVVDIGAYDPIRFSNTYSLYQSGWKGINIDPRKDCMKKFDLFRKNDINLNIGISDKPGELVYYAFEEPAYNTVDEERGEFVINQGYSPLIDKYKVDVLTLKDVLEKYLPLGQKIDFLALDVETFEINVLKSNDWDKYRPYFIAMESLMNYQNGYDIAKIDEDAAVKFLLNRDYKMVGKLRNKIFFIDKTAAAQYD